MEHQRAKKSRGLTSPHPLPSGCPGACGQSLRAGAAASGPAHAHAHPRAARFGVRGSWPLGTLYAYRISPAAYRHSRRGWGFWPNPLHAVRCMRGMGEKPHVEAVKKRGLSRPREACARRRARRPSTGPSGRCGSRGVRAGSSRVSLLAWCLWYLPGLFRLFQDAMQGEVRPHRKSAV
jgi:hypothetical protein